MSVRIPLLVKRNSSAKPNLCLNKKPISKITKVLPDKKIEMETADKEIATEETPKKQHEETKPEQITKEACPVLPIEIVDGIEVVTTKIVIEKYDDKLDLIGGTEGTLEDKDVDSKNYISLTSDQKEDLLDKLETRRYKLRKILDDCKSSSERKKVQEQIDEIKELLAKVKCCDINDKTRKNLKHKEQLSAEFKTKHKKLELSVFQRIIDLTASKEEREPDISTTMWQKQREIGMKKSYRHAPKDKRDKFEEKMQLKPLPDRMKKDLKDRIKNNITKFGAHEYHQKIFAYGKYDPHNYNGLTVI